MELLAARMRTSTETGASPPTRRTVLVSSSTLLYEAVTGRHPFASASSGEMTSAILTRPDADASFGLAGPIRIAMAHARLDDTAHAFEWLERAYAQRSPAIVHLREEVAFDNLRGDPRFQDLERRIGLPQP